MYKDSLPHTVIKSLAFHPKATDSILIGRSSGSSGLEAFPFRCVEQWQGYTQNIPNCMGERLTAAGTAPEFNRIPFSSISREFPEQETNKLYTSIRYELYTLKLGYEQVLIFY